MGQFTEPKATTDELNSRPESDTVRVCGILGKSHVNCCFPTTDQSRMSFTGCRCTIRDKKWLVIFLCDSFTVDHSAGSCTILVHALHTSTQLLRSMVLRRLKTSNMIPRSITRSTASCSLRSAMKRATIVFGVR